MPFNRFTRRVWNLVERRLTDKKLRVVSVAVLAVCAVLLGVSACTWDGGYTAFGTVLGADYPQFYIAGMMLNQEDPRRLYDLDLQARYYHELVPGEPDWARLPYVYPPFFAALLRPLASLPYLWSYLTWLSISICLFVAGFYLLCSMTPSIARPYRATILLLGLSYQPLVFECWLGGQVSTFGFFCVALALWLSSRGFTLSAGVALAFCTYKPTLLVLVIPLLIVTGRWRVLMGFAAGIAALTVVSSSLIGWEAFVSYVRLLVGYAETTATGFRTWKCVDVVAFFRLLTGGSSFYSWLLALSVIAAAIPFLLRSWLSTRHDDARLDNLLWASTCSWSLVLNVYVGIYDTVLVLPGMLLAANAVCRHNGTSAPALPSSFKRLLLLLYVTPWLSQFVALGTGFQPMTLVLSLAAFYQLRLHRETRSAASGKQTPVAAVMDCSTSCVARVLKFEGTGQ